MAGLISYKEFEQLFLDAAAMKSVVNGGDTENVVTRLGEVYPTFAKALKIMQQAGGAKAYNTLSEAQADIQNLVTNTPVYISGDTAALNGLYLYDGQSLVASEYDPLKQAKIYSDEQKVQKYTALNRENILYEVTDSEGNQTWLQVSSEDGMPTPYAKLAIRESANITDVEQSIVGGEPLLYYVEDAQGFKTAIAVRESDGMFAEFVIQNIKDRLSLNIPDEVNLDDLQYKPTTANFQILSSIARGVARHSSNVGLPSQKTDFTNSTNQSNRLTFPNQYNDATPLILVICFEGVGDQNLDIRSAYADILNQGVVWARSQFHGDSYGSPKAMQDATELYQKACAIAPIGGVVIVGNSMGGIAALNCLTCEAVPDVLGVYLTDPTYDLRQRYDAGRSSEINAAYECDASTYTDKTKGYDPALKHWSQYKGVPFSIVATSNDTLVYMSLHTNKLVEKLKNHNPISVIDTKSSGHNVAEEFIVSNLSSFIKQCASGPVITSI